MSFFSKKHKITIILKSGKTIILKCDEFKIKKEGNELTAIAVVGGNINLFYLNLDEVVAILQA